ncbi:MAG: hypothetical protein S4CHLAM123_03330 [Chlamydiales bacterium]|nr:hypothetical protein [Chlamydiales bacterium]
MQSQLMEELYLEERKGVSSSLGSQNSFAFRRISTKKKCYKNIAVSFRQVNAKEQRRQGAQTKT